MCQRTLNQIKKIKLRIFCCSDLWCCSNAYVNAKQTKSRRGTIEQGILGKHSQNKHTNLEK